MSEVCTGVYKHFKGDLYNVLFIAEHSETREKMVVYRRKNVDGQVWVRPIAIFTEEVKTDDGKLVKRFEFVEWLNSQDTFTGSAIRRGLEGL